MITETRLQSVYKMLLELPNNIHDEIMFAVYKELLILGDIVIEVGANVGLHTLQLSLAIGEKGKVFAFEPFSENVNKLYERISKSNIYRNIEVFELALSNYRGEADFKVFREAPGLCGFIERPWYDKTKMEVIKVEVDTLDRVLKDHDTVKLIKIDAEGADFNIIQGAKSLILRSKPLIIFEGGRIKNIPASLYGYDVAEFKTFFDSLGYELYDTLGMKFDYRLWKSKALNDFVAIPQERREFMLQNLQLSVFSVLVRYLNC